ncbi:MAG: hypothetical protein PHH41_01125 [Sulfurimonas sp.]|nr:hypothetical protein [Sulfurimonas sp.]MDD3060798.1 hypothetical protein [Sulfurimonas sp.]MDD5201723.1 hypothetical protein [Sulfurimonas sp.]
MSFVAHTQKELKTSLSTISQEALESSLEKKELQKWERGALLASQNEEYMQTTKEIGNLGTQLYDY